MRAYAGVYYCFQLRTSVEIYICIYIYTVYSDEDVGGGTDTRAR